MIRFDLHTHTVFSDGKNTPEEMVAYAEKNGIEILGISDHEYAPMQTSYCVSLENTPKYAETINALKEKSKIKLYLGTERDYFSTESDIKYDYVIGSVHSILKNGEYIDVDHSEKVVVDNVQRFLCGQGSFGYIQLGIAAVSVVHSAIFFKVCIITHSLTDFAVTFDEYSAVFFTYFIITLATDSVCSFKYEAISDFGCVSFYKINHLSVLLFFHKVIKLLFKAVSCHKIFHFTKVGLCRLFQFTSEHKIFR